MKHLVLSIPNIKLPSINHKYIVARGRMILSRQYRDLKEFLSNEVSRLHIDPPYRVLIVIETSCDIDNNLKVILDSLTGNCIDDDRDIEELIIKKKKIKRNKSGSLKVYVETITIEDTFKEILKLLGFK